LGNIPIIFRDEKNTKEVFFPSLLFLKIGKVVVKILLQNILKNVMSAYKEGTSLLIFDKHEF
jgi:hypothetical protein